MGTCLHFAHLALDGREVIARRPNDDHRRSWFAVLTPRPVLGKPPFQEGHAREPELGSGCARRANGRHGCDFCDGRRFLIRVQELIVGLLGRTERRLAEVETVRHVVGRAVTLVD